MISSCCILFLFVSVDFVWFCFGKLRFYIVSFQFVSFSVAYDGPFICVVNKLKSKASVTCVAREGVGAGGGVPPPARGVRGPPNRKKNPKRTQNYHFLEQNIGSFNK